MLLYVFQRSAPKAFLQVSLCDRDDMLLVPKERADDGQVNQISKINFRQNRKGICNLTGKSMAIAVTGLTMFLPIFTMCGTEKGVIWTKGCHLPLTNRIRNNHLFHDAAAPV